MSSADAIFYIQSLPKFLYPLGNEQLSRLLVLLGSPEKKLKYIHIAGTNGKGSAAAMLGSILTKAGYKTGIFTSPYLIKFNERIRIGDVDIPDNALGKYTEKLKKLLEENRIRLSQFAFILALAFCYYADEDCDIVVLEAGLGGRLDATNIIENSVVSLIMSIGLDHIEYLGNTIAEIALEKGGIIKKHGDVAVYRSEQAALDVFSEICRSQSARLFIAEEAEATEKGFKTKSAEYALSLKGEYQAKNAAAVLAAVDILRNKGYEIPQDALCEGFLTARHRGRFERVRENVIVDGGHNPDGIAALCKALESEKHEKTAVVAMMEDKAVDEALSALTGFSEVIVTELDMPRCMSAEALAEKAKNAGHSVRIIKKPFDAFKTAERCELAVICGSIYLAGRALEYFEL